VLPYSNDARPVAATTMRQLSKAELERYVAETEEKLNALGDDAQLANVDLQNILQKQQHVMQMMSNISKTLNDTASSVIRNIKG